MGSVTNVSNLGATILEDNGTNIIRGSQLSAPILGLLAQYSPEYNCLLRGIATYKPILAKTFGGGQVKQYVEFPTTQRRGYDRRDLPQYNDKRPPGCYGLPNPVGSKWYPWPGLDLKNGTNEDSKAGQGNSYFPAGSSPGPNFAQQLIKAMTGQSVAYRGGGTSPQQRQATAAVLSTRSGQPTSSISPYATLMYTPMVHRGAA
jgi:phospholipid/cholesterol/gamma-HCH transport system substrate-binding protein